VHAVSVTREIDAPLQAVWQVLDDFGGVAKYNPNVEASRIVAGPDTGAGATRECVLSDGGRIEEEIVDYEPGTGYTINFTDMGTFPLKKNVVEISVGALTEARTAVTMTASFTPKYGPVGWIMAETLMKSKFEETFESVLTGLESYVHAVETPTASD